MFCLSAFLEKFFGKFLEIFAPDKGRAKSCKNTCRIWVPRHIFGKRSPTDTCICIRFPLQHDIEQTLNNVSSAPEPTSNEEKETQKDGVAPSASAVGVQLHPLARLDSVPAFPLNRNPDPNPDLIPLPTRDF